jgi:hypothetical protein
MMRIVGLMLMSVVACGGASGRVSSAGSGRCWPIVAFRIEALEHGREWEPVLVVAADGTVRRPGSTKVRGTFTQERDLDVFTFPSGRITCGPDRVIRMSGSSSVVTYGPADELIDRSTRVTIDAAGVLEMGTEQGPPRARVVGDLAQVRRPAALLALLAMAL